MKMSCRQDINHYTNQQLLISLLLLCLMPNFLMQWIQMHLQKSVVGVLKPEEIGV